MGEVGEVETIVRWLRDRECVRELPLRYARAIDELDWDTLESLFHPEARWRGSLGEGPFRTYLREVYDKSVPYAARMHLMGNQYVSLEPGADDGLVETYTVSWNMEEPGRGREDLLMGVCYRDRVTRAEGAWLIQHRHAATQWVRGPFPRPE